MKTTKEKVNRRNTSEKVKTLNNNSDNYMSTGPSEEVIREKAEEIYCQRIDRGEHGTAEEDWLNAVEYLKESGN
jgi:hypothetical protein